MLRADVCVSGLPRACAPVEELFVHQVVLERHKRDALGERLRVPVRRHCFPIGGPEPGPGLSLPERTPQRVTDRGEVGTVSVLGAEAGGGGLLLEQHHLSLNVGRGEATRERGDPCVDLGQVPVAQKPACDLRRGGLASLATAHLFEHGGGTGGPRLACELERVLLCLSSRGLKPCARQIGDRVGLEPDEGGNQRASETIRDHRPAISEHQRPSEIIGLQSTFRSGLYSYRWTNAPRLLLLLLPPPPSRMMIEDWTTLLRLLLLQLT